MKRSETLSVVEAQWSAPDHVRALTTTRLGGFSQGVYQGLNLGDHVADVSEHVELNRQALCNEFGLTKRPQWLKQVHGTEIVKAHDDGEIRTADACWTDNRRLACIVMTADCLPVFFCDEQGDRVAIAHAGWRGLADGILESTLSVFDQPENIHVWLGPCIGPEAFEVGREVQQQFTQADPQASTAFKPIVEKPGKYLADLYELARIRLHATGVTRVSSCGLCTYTDSERFFSYRRDGETGRMASLIWIE